MDPSHYSTYYYPSEAYVPPQQFYHHGTFPVYPIDYATQAQYNPMAEQPLPCLSIPRSRSPSPTPTPAPVPAKRKGRPPSRKPQSETQIKTRQKAAKAASKTAAAKAKVPKTKDAGDKENEVQNVPIEIDDSDSETDGSERKHWSDIEKTKFFTFVLGPDAEGNRRFEQHKKNPPHVYKRASDLLFNGARSDKAVAGLWQRSIETYTWIKAFESFTGNGGGDPDSDNPAGVLRNKLEGANKAGLVVGKLTAETIATWQKNGWDKLFGDRLGASAKVAREVARNSAAPLSDLEDDTKSDDSGDDAPAVLKVPKTPVAPKSAAAVVSESKHTSSSKFRLQSANSLGNMEGYMKMKMLTEERKVQGMDRKLDLEHKRFELERKKAETDQQQAKLEMARSVLTMDGVDAQSKEAANAYIRSLFS